MTVSSISSSTSSVRLSVMVLVVSPCGEGHRAAGRLPPMSDAVDVARQRVADGLGALGIAGAGDGEGDGAGVLVDCNGIGRDRDRGVGVVVEDGGGGRGGADGRGDLGAGRAGEGDGDGLVDSSSTSSVSVSVMVLVVSPCVEGDRPRARLPPRSEAVDVAGQRIARRSGCPGHRRCG